MAIIQLKKKHVDLLKSSLEVPKFCNSNYSECHIPVVPVPGARLIFKHSKVKFGVCFRETCVAGSLLLLAYLLYFQKPKLKVIGPTIMTHIQPLHYPVMHIKTIYRSETVAWTHFCKRVNNKLFDNTMFTFTFYLNIETWNPFDSGLGKDNSKNR